MIAGARARRIRLVAVGAVALLIAAVILSLLVGARETSASPAP
jgi:iron complex transport system permease protein